MNTLFRYACLFYQWVRRFPHAVAFLVSGGMLLGALGFQYIGRLLPCEMCLWQRMPHGLVVVLSIVGLIFVQRKQARLARLALFMIVFLYLVSFGLGVMHVGVEHEWWTVATRCSADAGADLSVILFAPVTRCDEVPWSLWGVSMAGYNAFFSLCAASFMALCLRRDS